MLVIIHRVNEGHLLKSIPSNYGVEIDVRSDGRGLYLHHDPFVPGEKLTDFLAHYRHACLVVNLKEVGLVNAIREVLERHGVTNYFFLDAIVPEIEQQHRQGKFDLAWRLSYLEVLPTSLLNTWVWWDLALGEGTPIEHQELFDKNPLCVVSPELHSKPELVDEVIRRLQVRGHNPAAVCCKWDYREKWQKAFLG